MKKIVAINCIPRSTWNTATLVREAAKGAEAKTLRHETDFPEDQKKAFALGEQMVKGVSYEK